jgi:hypothetical protein
VLEADERGVDGPLVEEDGFATHLFNAARDAVAVQRADARERLEHHDVQRALEKLEPVFSHMSPLWYHHTRLGRVTEWKG